ncbi:MAG: sulfur carrier protein ThiS adenylyltransferase ThiF [Deltaproteobacteria bacterium]|jgi:sulfur carrier protein ThiS adenylyltransferase|nr:sulfur carrier protein ThiS adenylyltransferase ThiF [Deltaproteobacteria bacterium]MCW8892467.1 sulfur carrier protein ThiS adenylyltransferase ThiF [Deltaproteobacteria bacterium]MCW9049710.1 sulfur carrier protein ThiS adenylyltransferase ThiF [Deltaproteobacteria bacterium]
MNIYLNDIPVEINPDTYLHALRDEKKSGADILIINGFPQTKDQRLQEDDRVVMIRRGEQPTPDELEALMMARHTPGVHEKIKQARVGIAGIGGLGSNVAIALTRVGIGQLDIADFDVVEPSNLNRQQYFIDQIGMPKVEALSDILKRINPAVKVNGHNKKVTPENLTAIFGTVDILVEAFDAAAEKAMLTNHFLQLYPNKYLVAASGVAGYEPSNSIRTRKISKYFYLCGDGVTAAAPGYGLMAPRVGIAAHHQANTVLRLLLNEPLD